MELKTQKNFRNLPANYASARAVLYLLLSQLRKHLLPQGNFKYYNLRLPCIPEGLRECLAIAMCAAIANQVSNKILDIVDTNIVHNQ